MLREPFEVRPRLSEADVEVTQRIGRRGLEIQGTERLEVRQPHQSGRSHEALASVRLHEVVNSVNQDVVCSPID